MPVPSGSNTKWATRGHIPTRLKLCRSKTIVTTICAIMPRQALQPAACHPKVGSAMALVASVTSAVTSEIKALERDRPLARR